ncbi:MAG: alanine:cation symporter family protein [[Clostridium] scindens]
MTGTFFDTIVVCTITGLSIAASGVLGTTNAAGEPLQGIQVDHGCIRQRPGTCRQIYLVAIGIILFAFSTILGWEYHGEKAFEYLFKSHRFNIIYRVIFSLVVYVGATQTLDLVWNISDIMNALMAIPNLICILLLSNVVASEVKRFQPTIAKEKAERKAARATNGADAVGI